MNGKVAEVLKLDALCRPQLGEGDIALAESLAEVILEAVVAAQWLHGILGRIFCLFLEILDDGLLLSDEFIKMVNFIIEEVFIDGVSFQSSLVILCLQPELVIFTQQAHVLMHQLGDALLLVIDDGLDLLSFDVSLVVFLHV